MNRLLQKFDEWAETEKPVDIEAPHRFEPTKVPSTPCTEIDLHAQDVGPIIWATGYRPDYSWLDVPVLDRRGQIEHNGGVIERAPGLYVVGLNVLRRRGSSFIPGAERDSEELADHMAGRLAQRFVVGAVRSGATARSMP